MKHKPLGGPAYGSIGHLPNSRLGPGDHHVPQGQADICTVKCRPGDTVFVEEKLDGSCCAVWRDDKGLLHALTRAGYEASTSPYEQHWLFSAWVLDNAHRFEFLPKGCRLVGEWIAQACGIIYRDVDQPFVPFDLFMPSNRRVARDVFYGNMDNEGFRTPVVISQGMAMSVEHAYATLQRGPDRLRSPAAVQPEGLVYRVEHNGQFDFLAKWVRPDKVDGCYLPEVSGCQAVWNWGPKKEKP